MPARHEFQIHAIEVRLSRLSRRRHSVFVAIALTVGPAHVAARRVRSGAPRSDPRAPNGGTGDRPLRHNALKCLFSTA